jgi:hypothetical protein
MIEDDDVIQQVRAARDAYARSHGYDLHAIVADLRAQDLAGDWPVRPCPPRRAPAAEPANSKKDTAQSNMQRETLGVLAEVWALSPEVRLGQLLAHLDLLGEANVGKGLGSIGDDELTAVLNRHREELKARLEGAPR